LAGLYSEVGWLNVIDRKEEMDKAIVFEIEALYSNLMSVAEKMGIAYELMAERIDTYTIDGETFMEEVKEWNWTDDD